MTWHFRYPPCARHPLSFLLLAVVLATSLTAAAGQEVVVDGLLHVRNGATPPEGVVTVELEELWRVGDEDDELLLGLPTGLDWDAEGRLYLLDAQLNQVHVLSPDGELLDTRSREGDGPGEMRNPSGLIVWPDGAIGVVQEFPGIVVRLDGVGDPLPTLYPGGPPEEGGWSVMMKGRFRGDNLVLCGQMDRSQGDPPQRMRRTYVASFAPDGAERAAYVEMTKARGAPRGPESEQDMIQPAVFGWDVGPDGRVVYPSDWERYELRVHGPDGGPDRVIEREYEPLRRGDAERRHILQLFGVPEGQPSPVELADCEPTVQILQQGLQVTDEGEIWVLPSRGNRDLPDGILARFDVFDGQGHFRRQVQVRCQGDPLNDRLVVLPGGRMIRQRRFVDALVTSLGPGSLPESTREGEASTPAVICYRLVR